MNTKIVKLICNNRKCTEKKTHNTKIHNLFIIIIRCCWWTLGSGFIRAYVTILVYFFPIRVSTAKRHSICFPLWIFRWNTCTGTQFLKRIKTDAIYRANVLMLLMSIVNLLANCIREHNTFGSVIRFFFFSVLFFVGFLFSLSFWLLVNAWYR